MSKTLDRRQFAGNLAAAGVVLAAAPVLAQQRRADTIVTKIEWSTDQLEFHSGTFPPDTPVLFRATVKNIGTATRPVTQPISVDFFVNGELVSFARDNRNGLAAGEEITLVADGGPMGDRLWHNTSNEAQPFSISASTSPDTETEEPATLAVEAQASLADVAVAFANVVGTVASGGNPFVGAAAGFMVSRFVGANQNSESVSTSTPINPYSGSGSNGAYFAVSPRRTFGQVAQASGIPADRFLSVQRSFDIVPVVPGNFRGSANFSVNTLFDDHLRAKSAAASRTAGRAYAHTYVGEISSANWKSVMLRAEPTPFCELYTGNTTVAGGLATDQGLGQQAFYGGGVAQAALGRGVSGTEYHQFADMVFRTGWRNVRVPGYNTLQPIHGKSLQGLPNNLQPNGGGAIGGAFGYIRFAAYSRMPGQGWRAGQGNTTPFVITSCRQAQRVGWPLVTAAALIARIWKAYKNWGWMARQQGKQELERDLINDGNAVGGQSQIISLLYDLYFEGTLLEPWVRQLHAQEFMVAIRDGHFGPRRTVTMSVFNALNVGAPNQARNYNLALRAWDAYIHGDVQSRVYLNAQGLISWQ